MNALNEEIRIRFAGGGISPQTVDAKEIADLVGRYCECTRAIIKATPGLAEEDLLVSLTEIKDESLGFVFRAKAALLAAHLIFTAAVKSGNIGHLPAPAISFARAVRQFTTEKKCTAEFYENAAPQPTTVISANTELATELKASLTGKTLVYGKLERLGGKVPRATILVGDSEERYSCLISESLAKQLGQRIYEIVALECETDWNWQAQQGTELKARSIVEYSPKPAADSFAALRGVITKPFTPEPIWDDED